MGGINVKPSGVGTGTLQNLINTTTADALAPCVVESLVLTMQDKRVYVFHQAWFQLYVPSQKS